MSRNLPVLLAAAPHHGGSEPHDAAFDAQRRGQGGQRRGLRGGAPVLEAARAAYLDAEWRGDDDRRLAAGTFRRVAV